MQYFSGTKYADATTFLLGFFLFYQMTVSHYDLPSVEFCSTLNMVISGLLESLE